MLRRIKPSLYEFDNLPWAWVRLDELASVTGHEEIWDLWLAFFSLSKDRDVLAIASLDGEMWNVGQHGEVAYSYNPTTESWDYSHSSFEVFDTMMTAGFIYVPAGWAMDVIAAAEKGVVEVELVDHAHLDSDDECPAGTLNCYFTGSSFSAAVGLDAEGNVIPIPVTE